jgi:hypothetical protein
MERDTGDPNADVWIRRSLRMSVPDFGQGKDQESVLTARGRHRHCDDLSRDLGTIGQRHGAVM